MTPDSKASRAELRIEGEMTIYRAEELKRALIGPLLNAEQLEVDLSGVTEVDSVGLQLLMLAKRTARSLQGELRLVRHSPAVLEVFDLLHLAAYFGDQLVIPARTASASV
ncbi:MAG: STAS domain-containing protein [Polaromonas sp.]